MPKPKFFTGAVNNRPTAEPDHLWPVRLLQLYLSDLLNLIFPPEEPEGLEALWPWWKLVGMIGLLGGIGYLALG